MNRSILIVICDFLLVSLLAFSTVDINKATNTTGERRVSTTLATNQTPEASKDLTAVMRLALVGRKAEPRPIGRRVKSQPAQRQ